MLFELLVVFVKFSKLIWKNIGIWHKIEMLFAKSFLHPHNIKAEPVLSGDFIALREVINLLILIESFIQITLAAR